MSQFIAYGVPGSPYVRTLLLMLEEKQADYRLEALGFGETNTPDYLARQPFGRIPAMEHGDFKLYETQAMLRYIDRVIPAPPLIPTDPRSEARMNQVIGIVDCYVLAHVSTGIVFPRLIAPRFGLPVDEARIADSISRAHVCFEELARLLGDQAFMAGSALSLADLMLVPHMIFAAETTECRELMVPHVNLLAWLDRMSLRRSVEMTSWENLTKKAAA